MPEFGIRPGIPPSLRKVHPFRVARPKPTRHLYFVRAIPHTHPSYCGVNFYGSSPGEPASSVSTTTEIVLQKVNRDVYETGVPSHFTRLETLRYSLGLTGSKQGCAKGDCGACTVLVDSVPTPPCITAVWEAEGCEVTTVEGLATAEGPHPLQEEFDLSGAGPVRLLHAGYPVPCSRTSRTHHRAQP